MYHDYNMEKVLEHMKTAKKKNFILDTDTFNEIDDQFAITYAMLSEDVNLLALTAAPFYNSNSTSPGDGMEKSYEEMIRVRDFVDPENKKKIPCYRGSMDYMKNIITPQPSEAAENIVRLVREADDIVYIAVIGCYTNVASALLLDPSIADKAVILMVGANKIGCEASEENPLGHANEFNLLQDRCAARIIFECGIPLIVLPAVDGTERLYTTTGEMCWYLKDKAGEIGNYLIKITERDEGKVEDGLKANSRLRTIWDIASVAFLRKQGDICKYEIMDAMTIDATGAWRVLRDGRKMVMVNSFDRDAVMSDFYTMVRTNAR